MSARGGSPRVAPKEACAGALLPLEQQAKGQQMQLQQQHSMQLQQAQAQGAPPQQLMALQQMHQQQQVTPCLLGALAITPSLPASDTSALGAVRSRRSCERRATPTPSLAPLLCGRGTTEACTHPGARVSRHCPTTTTTTTTNRYSDPSKASSADRRQSRPSATKTAASLCCRDQ